MSKKDAFIDAVEALEREDYETAYKLFLPLAEQGDADAQFNLGVMYDEGEGVPQDYKEAFKWYRLAAEQGDAFAQFELGTCMLLAMGLKKITRKLLNGSAGQQIREMRGHS